MQLQLYAGTGSPRSIQGSSSCRMRTAARLQLEEDQSLLAMIMMPDPSVEQATSDHHPLSVNS